ncbi:NAD(P)H-binding protein [Kitasatospora sp. NPDC057692]|uniref:NAD(P)H-binding protein n=1 Tax=Kitasatospora sp. NPDC057692 TaxID=3346215 RepID=UPI0036C2DAFA
MAEPLNARIPDTAWSAVRKVLVVGATGTVGRHVTAQLLERGTAVRALSRDPGRAAGRLPPAAEVVTGDLTDPASLAAAARGVDAVFLVWPFAAADGAGAAVAALTAQGARMVFLSSAAVRDVPGRGPVSPGRPDAELEAAIAGSGAPHTFLRPHGFMANALRWAAESRASGTVRGFGGGAGTTPVDERDIAAVAVRALTGPGHDGARHHLTGPASPTRAEQVRIIGEAIGRPVRWEELPRPEALRRMLASGWPPPVAEGALDLLAARIDAPEPVSDTVPAVTGRPARTLREWAAEHAEHFR